MRSGGPTCLRVVCESFSQVGILTPMHGSETLGKKMKICHSEGGFRGQSEGNV